MTRTEYAHATGLRGQMGGYLPQHWPDGFAPRLIDFDEPPVGAFPHSHTLTTAGDVHLVPAAGHSPGQMAVIVEDTPAQVFIAGDVSYTEQTLRDQLVDGVAPDPQAAAQTLARTLDYVQAQPTIYLPSHDPDSAARLAQGQIVSTTFEEIYA